MFKKSRGQLKSLGPSMVTQKFYAEDPYRKKFKR
jgi:hypothetical protein